MQKRAGRKALHRKYHRVSKICPDEQIFKKYLIKRGYKNTARVFEEEVQKCTVKDQRTEIMAIFDNSPNMSMKEFKFFASRVKESCFRDPKITLQLIFLLHIWYCGNDIQQIPLQRLTLLKKFIQQYGSELSQIPVLLPYFALPYVQNPSDHCFLKRIRTQEWKNDVRKLLHQTINIPHLQNTHHQREQNEWLDIVKDLIHICLHFHQQNQYKNPRQIEMIERVKKYQNVLRDNEVSMSATSESIRPSQLSRLAKVPEIIKKERSVWQTNSLQFDDYVDKDVDKEIDYEKLKKDLKGLIEDGNQLQVSLIIHILHMRVVKAKDIKKKKEIIEEYSHQDVLLLKGNSPNKTVLSIEMLKLVQCLCFFSVGRNYVSHSPFYLSYLSQELPSLAVMYLNQNQSYFLEEQISLIASILQKISIHKQSFNLIISQNEFIFNIANLFLGQYKKLSERVLMYIIAFFMSVTLHRQGKQLCATLNIKGKSFFECLIEILEGLEEMEEEQENRQQTESFIYSILYMLLSIEKIKRIAGHIGFREKIIERMLGGSQYHRKIGQHFIQQLQNNENDLSTESQSDDSQPISEDEDYLWVGQKVNYSYQNLPQQAIFDQYYKEKEEQEQKYDAEKYTAWRDIRNEKKQSRWT